MLQKFIDNFHNKFVRKNKIKLKKLQEELDKKINYLGSKDCYDIYNFKIKLLKKKINFDKSTKISVAFFVMFDSVFPARKVFENMLKDSLFNAYVIVIPDILRGNDNMFEQMEKTFNTFKSLYGDNVVRKSWDGSHFIDYSNQIDIVISANQYDEMTHNNYRVEFLSSKGVLPIYINYSILVVNDYYKKIANELKILKYGWIIFSDSLEANKIYYNYSNRQSHKVLTGYPKLDLYNDYLESNLKKAKTIVISSHHTIDNKYLDLSNFIRYHNFFLELPKIFSNLFFVFRPHPLLKNTLSRADVWGKEKTDKYLNELLKNENVRYEDGGDYFQTFKDSDALIDDCGSFLAEYFITGKPQCYMIKNKDNIDSTFNELGKECLSSCYLAYNENDIISFINNVVIKGQDPLKDKRNRLYKKKIKIRRKPASEYIVAYIKKQFI